jgi:hypothetical protein
LTTWTVTVTTYSRRNTAEEMLIANWKKGCSECSLCSYANSARKPASRITASCGRMAIRRWPDALPAQFLPLAGVWRTRFSSFDGFHLA